MRKLQIIHAQMKLPETCAIYQKAGAFRYKMHRPDFWPLSHGFVAHPMTREKGVKVWMDKRETAPHTPNRTRWGMKNHFGDMFLGYTLKTAT